MAKSKKSSKPKKGVWFHKVRGSYLPATPEGWLVEALLLFFGIAIILIAAFDERDLLTVATTAGIQLIGLGALFTWLASRRA